MTPKIKSGELCTVEPILFSSVLAKGDVVLCKVNGREFLHLIKAVGEGDKFLIGNNRGGTNGWTNGRSIYGKLVKVEP